MEGERAGLSVLPAVLARRYHGRSCGTGRNHDQAPVVAGSGPDRRGCDRSSQHTQAQQLAEDVRFAQGYTHTR
jgi:hypothetical protein